MFFRRIVPALAFLAICGIGSCPTRAQSLGELLVPGTDLAQPVQRADIVDRMRKVEQNRQDEARRQAALRGWPLRVQGRDGAVMELLAFAGGEPLYATTHNVNAAISTGTDLLRLPPLSLTGAGVTVGVWDGGGVRHSHAEFGSRVTVKDGAAPDNHATHVAGTIGASGVEANAKGMATAVAIDSYEWTSDKSEMTSRGATYPGEPGKIYLSNQSYGYIAGWRATGLASPAFDWFGNGTTNAAVEQDFGKYETYARDSDALAINAPYFLMFRSAGNERYDNPGNGQPVALTANGTTTVSYDPAIHPPGDAVYKSGYDTISFDACAKNVITVGSVSDAVSGATRSAGAAFVSGFSSWGPTDDGRIKPDVVANGEFLYSSLAGSDTDYGTYSGTSMATPNACGSATLLVKHFDTLFPSQAMRASTLKALLIHTADDLGTPGPDYQTGWGLVNVRAAADLLAAYHASPGSARVIESQLSSAVLTRTHSFTWDGVSPIRATLVWADPAGTSTSTSDSRTARLVNNLDLTLTGPGGSIHSPFIMPYVGTWTSALLASPATNGKNNTDNVEQVLIAAPAAAGNYNAVVTVDGTLSGSVQNFSLLVSGSTDATAAPPSTTAVSPTSGITGSLVLNVSGANFLLGATVKLTRAGQADLDAAAVEVSGGSVRCRVDLTGRAAGQWNLVVTNPDGQSATLPAAFTIVSALWQDDLESGATGWTHGTSQGSIDNWALSTALSHSATHSYFAAGPASANINDLVSPAIAIPASATNLTLSFWHRYAFQSQRRDGGVMELSVDGGGWFDVTSGGSGASFATGGYNNTLNSSSNPLHTRPAWTGSLTSFAQVVVKLTDTAKFAGHTLRVRWRLATNNTFASTGWYLDDFVLTGGASAVNLPPSITTVAAAAPLTVTGTTTALSVAAGDDGGEALLTYTWHYTGGSFLTPVSFSENGTNAAKASTATFTAAGAYTFTVTARDPDGLSATSSVDVAVEQTATGLSVSPAVATVSKGATQLFAASALDQFGTALPSQPGVTWSTGGGGSIASDGTYTATTVGGPYSINATSGSLSGNASVSVTGLSLTTWRATHFTAGEISTGAAADLNDFDADGLANFLEYALGTDPRRETNLPAPAFNAAGQLTLTLTRPKNLPGVTYSGEAGSDLASWPTAIPIEVTLDGDPQTIRLTDPVSSGESPVRFLRIRATAP